MLIPVYWWMKRDCSFEEAFTLRAFCLEVIGGFILIAGAIIMLQQPAEVREEKREGTRSVPAQVLFAIGLIAVLIPLILRFTDGWGRAQAKYGFNNIVLVGVVGVSLMVIATGIYLATPPKRRRRRMEDDDD
jgi:hypothetical protein